MWPFDPEPVALLDTEETIYLDDKGLYSYPLKCDDEELYQKSLDIMKELLKEWMVQDIEYTTNLNQSIESSLVYQLKNIDLKYIANPTQLEVLFNCMKDTEINASGSRFFDTITKIYVHVPITMIRTFFGRFTIGMLYGIPSEINSVPVPSSYWWKKLMMETNWVAFILLVQDIFDNDDMVKKLGDIKEYLNNSKQYTTQIVNRVNNVAN